MAEIFFPGNRNGFAALVLRRMLYETADLSREDPAWLEHFTGLSGIPIRVVMASEQGGWREEAWLLMESSPGGFAQLNPGYIQSSDLILGKIGLERKGRAVWAEMRGKSVTVHAWTGGEHPSLEGLVVLVWPDGEVGALLALHRHSPGSRCVVTSYTPGGGRRPEERRLGVSELGLNSIEASFDGDRFLVTIAKKPEGTSAGDVLLLSISSLERATTLSEHGSLDGVEGLCGAFPLLEPGGVGVIVVKHHDERRVQFVVQTHRLERAGMAQERAAGEPLPRSGYFVARAAPDRKRLVVCSLHESRILNF